MTKLKFQISISLDGYVAGPEQSPDNPLGIGGEDLHEWVVELEAFNRAHGREGGVTNESTPVFEEEIKNIGATIMGRNMFGGGPGDWGDGSWKGWWGDEPPFHSPVYVLTHHEREPLELGDTTFHFVTDGIESALDQAKAAAGGKDVSLGGGADAARQYLRAGLIDEMLLNIVPILLGGGERLLDGVSPGEFTLEQTTAVVAPGVTHMSFRSAP